jgi:rhodanese-related sulfurtransferase
MPGFVTVEDLNPAQHLIDVRTASEFSTGHIAGAVNIPLDQIEGRIADIDPTAPLVLVCKAGTRARTAANLIAPCRGNASVLEGGMDAWYRARRPVIVNVRSRWSLERQVRSIAGLLVLFGVVAALAVNPLWIYLSGFVGLGLSFAGLTDFCAMGLLLGRMPWNQHTKLGANREIAGEPCVLKR